jgi:Mor family transcriptional regulator
MQKSFKKRNTQIYTLKETGDTYRSLSQKYKLSIQRIQAIVNRERINLQKDKI